MASRSDPILPPRERRRPAWVRRWGGAGLLVAIGLALQSLEAWHDRHAIFINASESLPNWALFVEAGRVPKRGDYVVFDPGRDPLVIKHFGTSPKPFAKIAYGVVGDTISRDGAWVLVNGHEVARLRGKSSHPDPSARCRRAACLRRPRTRTGSTAAMRR